MDDQEPSILKSTCAMRGGFLRFPGFGGLLRDLVRATQMFPEAGGAWIKGDYFPAGQWTSLADVGRDLFEAPLTFQSVVGSVERPTSGAIFEDGALLRIAGYRCCPAAAWEAHVWDSGPWIMVGPKDMALPETPQSTSGPFDSWIDPDGDVWGSTDGARVLPEARSLMADYRQRGEDWEYALAQTDHAHPAVRQLAAAVLGWRDRGEDCRTALDRLHSQDPDLGVRETAGTSLLAYRRD